MKFSLQGKLVVATAESVAESALLLGLGQTKEVAKKRVKLSSTIRTTNKKVREKLSTLPVGGKMVIPTAEVKGVHISSNLYNWFGKGAYNAHKVWGGYEVVRNQ